MLIRQDFNTRGELPPKAFLSQVMDQISNLYCWLWENQDNECRVDATWKEIAKVHNKNAFRSNIRKLGNRGLLSYCEDDKGIHIELVGWDEVLDPLVE